MTYVKCKNYVSCTQKNVFKTWTSAWVCVAMVCVYGRFYLDLQIICVRPTEVLFCQFGIQCALLLPVKQQFEDIRRVHGLFVLSEKGGHWFYHFVSFSKNLELQCLTLTDTRTQVQEMSKVMKMDLTSSWTEQSLRW